MNMRDESMKRPESVGADMSYGEGDYLIEQLIVQCEQLQNQCSSLRSMCRGLRNDNSRLKRVIKQLKSCSPKLYDTSNLTQEQLDSFLKSGDDQGGDMSPLITIREGSFKLTDIPENYSIASRMLEKEMNKVTDDTFDEEWISVGVNLHHIYQGSDLGLEQWFNWGNHFSGYRAYKPTKNVWNNFGESNG